jgi:hypothetical protein
MLSGTDKIVNSISYFWSPFGKVFRLKNIKLRENVVKWDKQN